MGTSSVICSNQEHALPTEYRVSFSLDYVVPKNCNYSPFALNLTMDEKIQ